MMVVANPISSVDDSSIDVLENTVAENPPQPNCQSFEFMDNGFDENTQDDKAAVYRRSFWCPQPEISPTKPNGKYTVPDTVPAKNNPYEKVSPTSDDDPCINTIHETLVTCGGPEALGLRIPHNSQWSPYVANCIPGKSLLLFPLQVSVLPWINMLSREFK